MSNALRTKSVSRPSRGEAARRRLELLLATTPADHPRYEALRTLANLPEAFADALLASAPWPAHLPELNGPASDEHDGAGGLGPSPFEDAPHR